MNTLFLMIFKLKDRNSDIHIFVYVFRMPYQNFSKSSIIHTLSITRKSSQVKINFKRHTSTHNLHTVFTLRCKYYLIILRHTIMNESAFRSWLLVPFTGSLWGWRSHQDNKTSIAGTSYTFWGMFVDLQMVKFNPLPWFRELTVKLTVFPIFPPN